ncbi:MAG: type II toxin-antitoxin system RelE/ParE family toxin [Planctomycetota bacterium]
MIQTFRDRGTEDVFHGHPSRKARGLLPAALMETAARRLDHLDSAVTLEDLRIPPGNRLKALRGDRRGQHSLRINDQYRICFRWSRSGPKDVQITDYH